MKSHSMLLNRLLQTLVDEWGDEAVASALATATASRSRLLGDAATPQGRPVERGMRLSATAQVERAALDGEKREALLQLAERYDRKQFLPSVADVREFLIMMGQRPVGMKDRREAFRVLLRSIVQLPAEDLKRLNRTALHSGPSQLGPLSDAISAAGERLTRQRQASGD